MNKWVELQSEKRNPGKTKKEKEVHKRRNDHPVSMDN